ncbi:helix-turn-helix domain-containing protein [Sphingomonas turrisvirgatae]|uniref:Excisionase n=1 Tax=Sphingomonas turrisvirgatae TaxID=1888892 RepID=A0A1E3LW64_9SPHN|nr:helix-turn-helix domain-containing protein [Sphingomonas turrisvirgatae]ODP37385.1 excisionase [Sphingomonas turrisvirgatae]
MEPLTTTVSNTCKATGLGLTKVYELINSGKLETVKVGRRRLVKTDSIRALVNA